MWSNYGFWGKLFKNFMTPEPNSIQKIIACWFLHCDWLKKMSGQSTV